MTIISVAGHQVVKNLNEPSEITLVTWISMQIT